MKTETVGEWSLDQKKEAEKSGTSFHKDITITYASETKYLQRTIRIRSLSMWTCHRVSGKSWACHQNQYTDGGHVTVILTYGIVVCCRKGQ